MKRWQTLWRYARVTLISTVGGGALILAYAYIRGQRRPCEFSDAFFWGGVLIILLGGVVAGLGGRGQSSDSNKRRTRRPLRQREQEEETERQERYQERERAISLGIAIAMAAIPLLLTAWVLCP